MRRRFLITGGCGFLGANLAAEALARGAELCVFDNLSRVGSARNLEWLRDQGGFGFVHGDVRNAHDVERAVAQFKPEVVFHVAGQVAMTTSLQAPRMDFEINALGTLNVLEALRVHAPRAALFYSSTNKVYGDLEWLAYEEGATRYTVPGHPGGFDESLPLDFATPYGCSKGAADQYIRDYARVYGMGTVVFRHSSMYGGRQFPTVDQGWIGWFCREALARASDPAAGPIEIAGNGKQVRDVLHADDMRRLYFAAVERIDLVRGEIFNVGGGMGNSLSLLELIDLLAGQVGRALPLLHNPPRPSDQKSFVADIGKAGRLLGWRPQVDAATGVRAMLDWLRTP
ncbi:MAG: NAD-dependent epimerase/dehydratase family protein [Gammaproteobacteria bacterium]